MKINFSFENIEPLPLNAVYATDFRTKRRFKSKKYTQFESLINNCLRRYRSDINKFNNKYDIEKFYIVAEYRFYYPITVKANNKVSKTSKDLTNCLKPIEDIIFKQLIADDSQVLQASCSKIHSKDIRIEVTLELKDLKHIL
tara:strand:+ start:101 stop:526 length:426 start_codon:yes stop_codon:yes gene_type:complete